MVDIITPFMNLIYKMIERFSDLSKEHLAHILTPLPLPTYDRTRLKVM
jgi:hypothetical protein